MASRRRVVLLCAFVLAACAPVASTQTIAEFPAGAIVATVPRSFPAAYHEPQSSSAFLNGLSVPAGGSIAATIDSGRPIVYGATVDNRTRDPGLKIAHPAP